MQTLMSKHWHHLPEDEVVSLLDSHVSKGLDMFEVRHRQARFGPNVITPKKGKSPLARFLLQFHNPLIYILLVAGLVTVVVKGEPIDGLIIFGVVLVNAVISFAQESKAEKAIEALAQAMTTEATVIRFGEMQRIPAAELVLGDVVVIKSGDRVPADMRLVRSRDLQIAEASLTGESTPVEKAAGRTLPPETVLAERSNMAYTSTYVTYGQGTGIVIATGDQTEIGRISQLISSAEELATPLTRKIAQFSRLLLWVILALAGITFLIGVLRGQPAIDTFTASIALAVAAIPEGLPAALTVTLAIGVSRMARRRAIIRKLPAVETLGGVTVICSDKTGTLTQNQMTVKEIWVPNSAYTVTGSGYAPEGSILASEDAIGSGALAEVLKAGMLCNDSQLKEVDGRWEVQGDPTEAALLTAARKAGLREQDISQELPRLDEIPFESQHQYMATLHRVSTEDPFKRVYLKGSVEAVLERCEAALNEQGQRIQLDAKGILRQVEQMAAQGLRVLAFASGQIPVSASGLKHQDVAGGMTFLGLQGMIDPPRPEAIEAVRACQQAGIRVKMITGDHALTASAIAAQLGLGKRNEHPSGLPEVMTGKALAEKSDAELIEMAQRVDVFARVSPEQKLRLVEALQAKGEVVSMTGDGVNDGPALKQADIGVAMGITGTEVAKEAADVVLTDDNFAAIRAAVEEGRGVFDNLTKIIAWTLPTNIGEGLVILLAILTGVVLPILPIQILWINMVSVSVLGLVLALEMKEPDIMSRPPRNPRAPILTRRLLWRVLLVGVVILAAAFGLFEWELARGASIQEARTVTVNAVILIEIFYLFNARALTQSVFRIGLLSNRWAIGGVVVMVLLQLLYTYNGWMNLLFHSAPIPIEAWVGILLIGFVGFWLVEFEKWIVRRNGQSLGNKRRANIL